MCLHVPTTSAAETSDIASISYSFFTPLTDIRKNPTDLETVMDTAAIPALPGPPTPNSGPSRRDQLMAKAEQLEATFLAEMLAHSGLGEMQGAFGGGQGEAQFTSFLRQEQARLIVEKGGIGMAELIFNTMAKVENVNVT
jgi:flagellar protein FlgJ